MRRIAVGENVPDSVTLEAVRTGNAKLMPWQKHLLSCFPEKGYRNYPDHLLGIDGVWRFSTWEHLVDDTVRCQGTQMAALLSLTYKPRVVVEMGVYAGATLMLLCGLNPRAKVYGVDILSRIPHVDIPVGYMALLQEPKNLEIFQGKSWEFDLAEEVDLCFIDGEHTGDAPYKDSWRAFNNRNISGNWCIAWDDYHPNNPDVKNAVDAFVKEVGYELHKLGSWVYIGTKVVGSEFIEG